MLFEPITFVDWVGLVLAVIQTILMLGIFWFISIMCADLREAKNEIFEHRGDYFYTTDQVMADYEKLETRVKGLEAKLSFAPQSLKGDPSPGQGETGTVKPVAVRQAVEGSQEPSTDGGPATNPEPGA